MTNLIIFWTVFVYLSLTVLGAYALRRELMTKTEFSFDVLGPVFVGGPFFALLFIVVSVCVFIYEVSEFIWVPQFVRFMWRIVSSPWRWAWNRGNKAKNWDQQYSERL